MLVSLGASPDFDQYTPYLRVRNSLALIHISFVCADAQLVGLHPHGKHLAAHTRCLPAAGKVHHQGYAWGCQDTVVHVCVGGWVGGGRGGGY